MKAKYGIILGGVLMLILIGTVWFLKYRNNVAAPFSNPTSPATPDTAVIEQSNTDLRNELKKALLTDADLDGISNEEEKSLGTNPQNPDSDADGLLDGDEVRTYHSDPLKNDSDGDKVLDGRAVRSGKHPVTGKSLRQNPATSSTAPQS